MFDPGASPGSAGRELDLSARRLSGARAHRAVHTGAMTLEEHRHDWPCLAFHLLGRYLESNEDGESLIDGPAVVLHGRGGFHSERFSASGAEALILEFDPAWLGPERWGLDLERTRLWAGAGVAADARSLAARWLDPAAPEAELRQATAAFLQTALADARPTPRPQWLEEVTACIREETRSGTPEIAARLGLHPAWLARAYRASVGEGLRETVRRVRTEQAIALLRSTDLPLAQVALEAGFCDQSHMNRDFRRLLGRTPAQVRSERKLLTPAPVRLHGLGRP